MLGKLRILGEIIVVTVCAYFLGQGAYMLVKPVRVNVPVSDVQIQARQHKNMDRSKFEIINVRNLFGALDPSKRRAKKKPKPKKKDLSALPVTTANMRLSGTIYSSVPAYKRAVLVIKGRTKVVKLGEVVQSFKVVDIKRRAVVLQKGKRQEILMIGKGDKKIAAKSDSGSILVSRRKLQGLLARPEDILSKVEFAPAKINGKKGLVINSLQKDSVLAGVGIRKGDLIVSVNGRQLNSMKAIMRLGSLQIKDSIQIKIWRKGRYETLKLKLKNA